MAKPAPKDALWSCADKRWLDEQSAGCHTDDSLFNEPGTYTKFGEKKGDC